MSVLAKNMGLHLYASAQATEAAQDGIRGTNGTFTAQLLAGIKGAAKQDAEGNELMDMPADPQPADSQPQKLQRQVSNDVPLAAP